MINKNKGEIGDVQSPLTIAESEEHKTLRVGDWLQSFS